MPRALTMPFMPVPVLPRLEVVVCILLTGPSPSRWISNALTQLSLPAKNWLGFSVEKSKECGAMKASVVRETSGYEAIFEGANGEYKRMGRQRKEARNRVEAGFWRE